jgi:hypothetical protein
MCFLAQYGFEKWTMFDNRRFDARCGCCDERHATRDMRATIDVSTRNKMNSRLNKSNTLLERSQHYLTSWDRERHSKARVSPQNRPFFRGFCKICLTKR